MLKLLLPLTLTAALGLAAPALASASTSPSANWSGYAAHGKGAKFKQVSASWREPSGECTATGQHTYSAFWVGIGGYSLTSGALEQIGTEFDCTATGTAKLSAWYELVPASSRSLKLTVHAGDLMHASVNISGEQVQLTLTDETRHKTFTKTITDHTIDNTSAEWITEAPSECSSTNRCVTLPLADFDQVAFSGAKATTTTGEESGVTSKHWDTTEIVLAAGGTERFASTASTDDFEATPSALTAGGSDFAVAYTAPTTSTTTTPTTPTGPPGGFQPGSGGAPA
jgi:hypothetical protein